MAVHTSHSDLVQMKHILLTGAGFSRNWGGWLASEAFEYLLGSIYIDDPLRAKLWQTKERGGGFEDTLFELQTAHAQQAYGLPEQQLFAITNAVRAMFAEMAVGYTQSPFDDKDRFPIKLPGDIRRYLHAQSGHTS